MKKSKKEEKSAGQQKQNPLTPLAQGLDPPLGGCGRVLGDILAKKKKNFSGRAVS